ncbi:MAG: hypothetical protein KTR24_06900, partial [Saprospiraceae bacterium]|nr:hypothetical protein [Saprospiraceae bacterium]
PLIVKVTKISDRQGKPLYRVRERPFKRIPFFIKYYASVEVINHDFHYEIIGLPWTSGHLRYTLRSKESGPHQIQVSIELVSKLPSSSLLLTKMWRAQDHIMRNLQRQELPGL